MEQNGISLRDKAAVVTGGGQSLGLAISRRLAELMEGADERLVLSAKQVA